MGTLIDASTEKETSVVVPSKETTSEVLEMVLGRDDDAVFDEDIVFGRLSQGFDVSDFDVMPRDRIYDTPNQSEGAAGDELDLLAGDEEIEDDVEEIEDVPSVFQSPAREQFPVFKQALREFQAEGKPKVARIDNDGTYGEFVCEKAVNELTRRMDALEEALHAHMGDEHAHHVDRVMDAMEEHIDDPFAHQSRLVRGLRNSEILGAAQAISDIQYAPSPDAALEAMPQIPINVPPFAEGKVKCWKDGDFVICSMKFEGPDGAARFATMASKPKIDEQSVESWAVRNNIDPVDLLGMLDDAADVACGKRLVRDTARAALRAQECDDVKDMDDEPVLLGSNGSGSAPLAALMYVQQRADAGDGQAQSEMSKIRLAAQTKSGRVIAAPLLDEADRRLSEAKQEQTQISGSSGSFADRYALMGYCL